LPKRNAYLYLSFVSPIEREAVGFKVFMITAAVCWGFEMAVKSIAMMIAVVLRRSLKKKQMKSIAASITRATK